MKIIFVYDSLLWKLESYVSLIMYVMYFTMICVIFVVLMQTVFGKEGFPFNSVSYRWSVKFLKVCNCEK